MLGSSVVDTPKQVTGIVCSRATLLTSLKMDKGVCSVWYWVARVKELKKARDCPCVPKDPRSGACSLMLRLRCKWKIKGFRIAT